MFGQPWSNARPKGEAWFRYSVEFAQSVAHHLFFSVRLPAIRDTPARFLGAFVTDQDGHMIRQLAWPRTEIEASWLPPP